MKKGKAVKTKKAIKRLDRVADLLSKLIDQYATVKGEVRELLESAKAAVVGAKVKAKAPAKTKSGATAKSSEKEQSPRITGSPKKQKPLKAKEGKKKNQTAEVKRKRKGVAKSRTSVRSTVPKVAAASSEAGSAPDRSGLDMPKAASTI